MTALFIPLESDIKHENSLNQSKPQNINIKVEDKPGARRNIKRKTGNIDPARIVIRNLSYHINEEKLKRHFEKHGEVVEVKLLKHDNGRIKGIAFVQYKESCDASTAVKEENNVEFMGRQIKVEIATPKEIHKNINCPPIKIKEEKDPDFFVHNEVKSEEEEESEEPPKIESEEDSDSDFESLKEEENEEDLIDIDSQMDEDEDVSDEDSDENEDEGVTDEDSNENEDNGTTIKEEKPSFPHKPVSKDVMEGKTLFLRNLSFDVSESELMDKLSRFGDLKYIALCRDKITQRPRGTAFAQFWSRDSADECLEASTDPAFKETFKLGFRSFYVSRAVGRDSANQKVEEEKTKVKEPKDKRNLYLAREGVIRQGTRSAEGVSKSDLNLRVQREIMKRKMLTNLNTFVSPFRLFVCNLPLSLTDKELRRIFQTHSPKGAVINECRIMKNLYKLDNEGNPVSKGHGFITFKQHLHALEALRNINNNPRIFTANRRPVVEFSLENKGALKAKEKRIEKSHSNNKRKFSEMCQNFEGVENGKKNKEESSFMGCNYNPKIKGLKALHTHIGPKIRHRDEKKKKGGMKITRNKINNQMRSLQEKKSKSRSSKNSSKNSQKSKSKKNKSKEKNNAKGGKKSKENSKASSGKSKFKKRKFLP